MSVATTAEAPAGAAGTGEKDLAGAITKRQPLLRMFALTTSAFGFIFVINAWLDFWHDFPGIENLVGQLGLLGFEAPRTPLDTGGVILALVQLSIYLIVAGLLFFYVRRTRGRSLTTDADKLSAIAAYIARAAFWAVLFIGIADAVISFLRVEGFLVTTVGKDLAQDLGRSSFRGEWVHFPLMVVALIIAWFNKSVSFVWLALLVVVAELQIVILRFVFSYEQAFMADLVRFWYAAMFLFASAYTLLHEGHVRVDVLYSGFGPRKKAWANAIGAVLLGAPVCWIVLTMGLANKFSTISGPLLSFEVTQSGFGMYVKYLLAGYLLVFALTMLLEFMAAFLRSAGVILKEPDALERQAAAQAEESHGPA